MSDALTIGGSTARARAQEDVYRKVLGFDMTLHLVLGLGCAFLPGLVSRSFGLPDPVPTGWIRGWGATMILVTALYVPGLQNPMRSRWPNIVGVAGRVWMAAVWFAVGGGFIWFGLFDLSFAIILGWLFYRYCVAELMSRP